MVMIMILVLLVWLWWKKIPPKIIPGNPPENEIIQKVASLIRFLRSLEDDLSIPIEMSAIKLKIDIQ